MVLANPSDSTQSVAVPAHLDTGAEYSLFQGDLAPAIGLTLLDGKLGKMSATTGAEVTTHEHTVLLANEQLGSFQLPIRFAVGIRRNLLGRDFLNFLRFGLREQYLQFYLARE